MSLSRIQKIGAGTAAAAVSATALLGGTYATFTASEAAPAQSIASGTVDLALNAADGTSAAASTNISNIAPGDTIQRYVTVTNTGSLNIAGLTLSGAIASAVVGHTALFTHEKGVTVKVDRCSAPWTTSSGLCDATGAVQDVAVTVRKVDSLSTAVPFAEAAIPDVSQEKAYYKVTYFLPDLAPNELQGLTANTTLTFNATQRGATTTSAA